MSLSRLFYNLQRRLQLLRIITTRSHIWPEIISAAMERTQMTQIRGSVDPLSFARVAFGSELASAPPLFSQKLGDPKSFTPPGFPAFFNSEPSVSHFLGQLVFYKKPAIVVELGSFVGWTSAHLALAMQANGKGHLYILDIDQAHLDAAAANLQRLGLADSLTTLLGGSIEAAPRIKEPIDILFIDTSHLYPDTLNEILCYAPRMAPGGCIVLHDSMSFPGVRRSVEEVSEKFRILTFATEKGNGATVLLDATTLPSN